MKKLLFNDNWYFWKETDAFSLLWNIPGNAKPVTLPHDAMIEEPAKADSLNKGNTGYRDGAVYNYAKQLYVGSEAKEERYVLHFQGIYMKAFVYVNGALAGQHFYGYTDFYTDITDYIRYDDKNEIRVVVRNGAMTNSRWYSGGGIYRNVYLLTGKTGYFQPGELRIDTTDLDGDKAILDIRGKLIFSSEIPQGVRVCGKICRGDTPVTVFETELLKECNYIKFKALPELENPVLWSAESPELYQMQLELLVMDQLLDEESVSFGVRTLELAADTGLLVNGRQTKLRGACIHHDNGVIGAACYADAAFRRVAFLKGAGFNAIRMAHHPVSEELLTACDTLGMYPMDEYTDMWTRAKNEYDYSMNFVRDWQDDIYAMVSRDYNHPSVIMYSVGNEIPEFGSEDGARWCRKLSDYIHSLDPFRYTTAGINGVYAAGDALDQVMRDVAKEAVENGTLPEGNVNDFMTIMDTQMDRVVVHPIISDALDRLSESLDIMGYNYMTARYEYDQEKRPQRVMVGSETYPPEIGHNWSIVRRTPSVIGDFTWTGWDYIGEAGVGIAAYHFGEGGFGAQYPCYLAYCGDFDITGFRRPMSYFREIVFDLRRKPYITVQKPRHYYDKLLKTPWMSSDNLSSWTWPGYEGKPIMVEVYAAAPEVELFINGRSIGKKACGKENNYTAYFDTVYEAGALSAVARYEDGSTESYSVETTGPVSEIHIEKEQFPGVGKLQYYVIELRDGEGRVVMNEDCTLSLEVLGAGRLLGFGSANPKTPDSFLTGQARTFLGRALAVVENCGEGDDLHINCEAIEE